MNTSLPISASRTRTLALPEELCKMVEEKFGPLEATLQVILEHLADDRSTSVDKDDVRLLTDQLKALGYL